MRVEVNRIDVLESRGRMSDVRTRVWSLGDGGEGGGSFLLCWSTIGPGERSYESLWDPREDGE